MLRARVMLIIGVLVVALGGVAGCSAEEGLDTPSAGASGYSTSDGPRLDTPSTGDGGNGGSTSEPDRRRPLAGKVVVLDPGHQRGNGRFPRQVRAPVDAGGFEKACNTTGTSTDDGYPESTFAWQVTDQVRRMLRGLGARVVLTRAAESEALWGPCVDERGRIGNPGQPGPTADVRLSVHADGVRGSGARGFHVIRPGQRAGWTDDVAARSEELARAVRDALVAAGFATSSYRGTDGIDVRTDLGTLNHSDVPVVMAELGNMRDPDEAASMRSEAGRKRYARALVHGLRAFLR